MRIKIRQRPRSGRGRRLLIRDPERPMMSAKTICIASVPKVIRALAILIHLRISDSLGLHDLLPRSPYGSNDIGHVLGDSE